MTTEKTFEFSRFIFHLYENDNLYHHLFFDQYEIIKMSLRVRVKNYTY